ncbi:gluconokinase [Nakamurella sp. DB0629]|uniref:Gluconokinase n=1 Tax=Nakamurella aerolata TaxID=1656892 RepID=A0A849A3J5_9ACTN|nr:gluconokinase [Nakamurella aerolata]NNG35179.1 gluconokinase [Nakamurella aerolata]
MGVSGSGKSTVAGILAGQLGWDLGEGDDMHPEENVAKMAAGEPLTDDDRWPWLETVCCWITEHNLAGIPGIITCSALKRSYRDVLRGQHVVFVLLAGDANRIGRRMAMRTGHYMPTSLLDSQLSILEPPGQDERAVVVDIDRPPAAIAAEVVTRLALRPDVGSSGLGAAEPGADSAGARAAPDGRRADPGPQPPPTTEPDRVAAQPVSPEPTPSQQQQQQEMP